MTQVKKKKRRPNEFSRLTQRSALIRQNNKCASCGEHIWRLGEAGRSKHRFGENAQAHHRRPVRMGGSNTKDNCVILCHSCHYSAHEGGSYRLGTVIGRKSDYPYFRG